MTFFLKIPLLMASISVVSAFHMPRVCVAPFTSLKRGTELSILTLNLSNNDKDAGDPQEDESDFPVWVKGLRQWPLYPSKPSLLNEVSEQEQKLAREVLEEPAAKITTQIPLANLVNVEALLMASGEEAMEDKADLALFELNQFVGKLGEQQAGNATAQATPLSFISNLQEFGDWNNFVLDLRKSVLDLTTETSSKALTAATESIFKEATARLEFLVSEVSTAISPQAVQALILSAGKTLALNEGAANDLVAVAEKIAREQGLDVREAADKARETAKLTTSFVTMANDLLVSGYARKDTDGKACVADAAPRALFDDFESVRLISDCDRAAAISKAAEMGTLCGAIYEETAESIDKLQHSVVATGTTANVTWMVTDSICYEENYSRKDDADKNPFLARTITIRGFDASDDDVDREELLIDICTATPESLGKGVFLHTGLLKLARGIYEDLVKYIDTTAPTHKVVLTGHSIGGSLSVLLLLLLTQDRGVDFVNEKIARVYTFGSPPISTTSDTPQLEMAGLEIGIGEDSVPDKLVSYRGDVLERFGLRSDIVYGYVQPWDPIVRFFSYIDPLYPLIGDLGEDQKTLYASGPPRTLRPITRAIIESWENWPTFRDSFKATVSQNYTSIGIQHILLSEPVRYISDQLVAVNVQIPPVDCVVRISSEDLLPALDKHFPVDVFRISFVPVAIRSFVHHFYPAYVEPFVTYADKKQRRPSELNKSEQEKKVKAIADIVEKLEPTMPDSRIAETSKSSPSQWLQFPPDW